MMRIVVIQHDLSTGRYHPADYLWHPLPGPGPDLLRYKSHAHHTLGFETLPEAQASAAELARVVEYPIPEDHGFKVLELSTCGPHILLLPKAVEA